MSDDPEQIKESFWYKSIKDPKYLDKLISKYENLVRENNDVLSKITEVQSLKEIKKECFALQKDSENLSSVAKKEAETILSKARETEKKSIELYQNNKILSAELEERRKLLQQKEMQIDEREKDVEREYVRATRASSKAEAILETRQNQK